MTNAFERGKKLLCGDYSQYTPTGKSYFVRAGRWYMMPETGDIVYFYYEKLGRVGHVGVVTDVTKKNGIVYIETIEGNTSGTAGERNGGCVDAHAYEVCKVGGKNHINGFGRPVFGPETCTKEEWIATLKKELGYVEKESEVGLDSKTANPGSANFTKYGKWYGQNGVYWCQQFVSWCAYEACRQHMETSKTGWEQQEDGSWKYKKYGAYICDQWERIATKAGLQWFVFDGSGEMITGWFKGVAGWYYLNPADGAMLESQWFRANGKWYYATASGLLAKNVYVKDAKGWCWCDKDGAWNGEYTQTPDLARHGAAE